MGKVEAVYFEAIPHTSLEAREKVLTLAKKLAKYQTEVKVHIVPFTKIQEEIYKNVKEDRDKKWTGNDAGIL